MDDEVFVPVRHKLDVEAYGRMTDAGIFAREERIELIDGDLIDMAPIGQGHEAVVNALTRFLVFSCGDRAIVSVQNSMCIDRWSQPQPDFAVLRPRADFYATGARPGPADVLLLVEVAGSSLRYDRTVKSPLYARAGIPEFWIVDLKSRAVDVYRKPAENGYKEMSSYQFGDQIALVAAPEIVVTLGLAFG